MNNNQYYQQEDFSSMLSRLKANPMQFIMQYGMKVPPDILSNPTAMIQYLMNSGQVTQGSYNNAMQQLGSMMFAKR